MPLSVSIIIPSAGRRLEFLQRAIKSALIDDKQIQTEIIVVLNGKDGMAFDTSLSFQHPLVSYHKLEQGNVSKARNYGLSIAVGDLIRFLDDDDYLYSDIACLQYLELFHSDADLSTYCLMCIDEFQNNYDVSYINKYNDGFSALFSGEIIGTTINNLYKNNLIRNLKWNELSCNGEDVEWFTNALLSKRIRWIYKNEIVGVWYQHSEERLSLPYSLNSILTKNINQLIEVFHFYGDDPKIKNYLGQGLMNYAHLGIYLAPIYWTKIAIYAKQLNPNARPKNYFFDKLSFIHPILLEWLIIPIRWLSRYYRMFKSNFLAKSYVRKL